MGTKNMYVVVVVYWGHTIYFIRNHNSLCSRREQQRQRQPVCMEWSSSRSRADTENYFLFLPASSRIIQVSERPQLYAELLYGSYPIGWLARLLMPVLERELGR